MSYSQYKRVSDEFKLPPAPPLTPVQRRRAEAMRDAWRVSFSGDDSFIRQMVDAGLIYGWRDVQSVTPIKDKNHGDI